MLSWKGVCTLTLIPAIASSSSARDEVQYASHIPIHGHTHIVYIRLHIIYIRTHVGRNAFNTHTRTLNAHTHRTLSTEGRKKFPDLKVAAEQAVLRLRPLTAPKSGNA